MFRSVFAKYVMTFMALLTASFLLLLFIVNSVLGNEAERIKQQDMAQVAAACAQNTAELFEADPCNAALADIKKHFSVYDFNGGDYDQNYSAEEKISIINENIHVAVDFYRRFAERLETLLRENADCNMICISGP